MNIPKSYEALAADLASEKIISKTLLGQKEAYMMLADKGRLDLSESKAREAALRESLTDKREEYSKLGDRYDDLQQRLTVADQRAGELEQMLADVPQIHFEGCDFQGWNQDGSEPFEFTDGLIKKIKSIRMVGWRCDGPRMAALNPDAEPTIEVARQSLSFENQRIQPARFHCLACGEYHEGSGNLPCPKMKPMSGVKP